MTEKKDSRACACARASKIKAAKEILRELLSKNKTDFCRYEIDNAIIKVLWLNDNRAINNWFSLLWNRGYFTTPKPDHYLLNLSAVQELDVEIPDLKQSTLEVKKNE